MDFWSKIKKSKIYTKIKEQRVPPKTGTLSEGLTKDFSIGREKIERSMNIRLISGVLGVMIFLLGLVTVFTIRSMSSIVSNQLDRELHDTRIIVTSDIKEYYNELEVELERLSIRLKEKRNISSENINPLIEKYIMGFYIIDKNYKVTYSSGEEKGLKDMISRLEKKDFQKPYKLEGIGIDNGTASQYIYYKFFDETYEEHYIAFKLSTDFLTLKMSGKRYEIEIINEEYYVVAATEESKVEDVQLDKVTKNVLGGDTGIESSEGRRYSYGNIDLGETAIFIMVSENQDSYFEVLSNYKRRMMLLWGLAIGLIIMVIVFLKIAIDSFASKIVRITLDETSDKKYPYLKREYISLFNNIEGAIEGVEKISEFIEEIELLKKRVENQNQNYIKEVKIEEEFKKRVEEMNQ